VTDGVRVRAATVEELPDVLNVLDGGALAVDSGRLRSAIDREDVLVAVAGASDAERVLGALALSGGEITAVAVRPGRRGQGIGTQLVEAAADRRKRLVAAFDAGVRPFWTALGFEVRSLDGLERRRFHGVRE
jgi:GNAT superfamily N-acetyltransferase